MVALAAEIFVDGHGYLTCVFDSLKHDARSLGIARAIMSSRSSARRSCSRRPPNVGAIQPEHVKNKAPAVAGYVAKHFGIPYIK